MRLPDILQTMWCEQVLRNAARTPEADWNGRVVERVELAWNECGRVVKTTSRDGEPIRVLLRPGEQLRHGDVIFEDATRSLVIHVTPCEVIVAQVADSHRLAILAMELGNLHWPAQVGNAQIIFIEDGPAMAVLEALGIPWTKEVRRFEPDKMISAPAVSRGGELRVIRRQPQRPDEGEGGEVSAGRSSASND